MRHRTLPMLLACGSLLAALPAAAEVYTIRLTNGSVFESRYQPKQASWDAGMMTFLDETGLEVALPKALIAEVTPQSELKGFGKIINTTTVDLGFAPNDLDQNAAQMQAEADQQAFLEQMMTRYDQQQFVEPSEVGGGIPVGFAAGGGGGALFLGGGGGGGFGGGGVGLGGGGPLGGGVSPPAASPLPSSPAPSTPITPPSQQ